MFLNPDEVSEKLRTLNCTNGLLFIDSLEIKKSMPHLYHCFRAEAYLNESKFIKALSEVERSIESFSLFSAAYNIKANILVELGRFQMALDAFDIAVQLSPMNGDYIFNRGQLKFLMEDWEGGRRDYEFRLTSPIFHPPAEIASKPLWRGDYGEGKRLLVYWEQGQGDTLQFIRFISVLRNRGLEVVVEVQDSLRRLVENSFPTIQVISSGENFPNFDYRAAIPSLPWLLKIVPTATTMPQSYLRAVTDKKCKLETVGLGVGLVWAGNPAHVNDQQRSLPQGQMLSLAPVADVSFYSLQVGVTETQRNLLRSSKIIDLTERIVDFADTAAAIDALDLVITVDTSVAHLAGAMGKPVWILLPFVPDWRWLLNRSDSPWYPSARLFRQPKRGDWASVLREVKKALITFRDEGGRDQGAANSAA